MLSCPEKAVQKIATIAWLYWAIPVNRCTPPVEEFELCHGGGGGGVCRDHIFYSLVPRPSAFSALLTFELARNQKSGGGPGEFYHVSDVKDREKVERT